MLATKRSLSVFVVATVVSGGLALAPAPAHAAEPPGPTSERGLLDLPLPPPDQLPALSGVPLVGQLLTVTQPVWNVLPGVLSSDITWWCNGAPIPGTEGLWSFVPTEAQAGCQVTAQVVTTVLGFLPLEMVTNALQLPAIGGDTAVRSNGAPTVRADQGAKVGTTLSVSVPATWEQAEVTTTYQWLRAGSPIGGATGTTYRLVAADLDQPITVRATGRKADHTDGTAVSNAITALIGDAPTATTQPSIQGSPEVGETLTVNPGVWGTGEVPTFAYQWRRDNDAIAGATGATYRSVAADVGRTLTVTVTATRPGHRPGTYRAAGLEVQKRDARIAAILPKRSVKQGTVAAIKLLLNVPGGIDTGGPVTIYDGTKVLKKVTIGDGPLTVRLGKLKPGVHKLMAVYAGSDTVEGAKSKVVTLTVKKTKKKK